MRSEAFLTVIIWRGDPADLPPLLSFSTLLAQHAGPVRWLCGTASPDPRAYLESHGVAVHAVNAPSTGYESWPRKLSSALKFRSAAWTWLDRLPPDARLWIANAETAIVLGRRLLDRRYTLHAFELPESPFKRRLSRRYFAAADHVIVPEPNRAQLIRDWFALPSLPTVVPNVPFIPEDVPSSQLNNRAPNIALYQGMIAHDRPLATLARVIARRRTDWDLVLLGRDFGALEELRRIHPGLIHLQYVPPPGHLGVTRLANIGIACYSYDSLNNRFCAPNKIYEYAALGVPILANDVPGLVSTVRHARAGICCDFNSESELNAALETLTLRHAEYSGASRELYNSALSSALHHALQYCTAVS